MQQERRKSLGHDLDARAWRIMELRGDISYEEALAQAGDYSSEIFIDQIAAWLTADTEDAFQRGYRVTAAAPGSDAVDVELIARQELDRLGRPLPTEVARLGASELGKRALNILARAGVVEYDAPSYTKAIRQAIVDVLHPKRSL